MSVISGKPASKERTGRLCARPPSCDEAVRNFRCLWAPCGEVAAETAAAVVSMDDTEKVNVVDDDVDKQKLATGSWLCNESSSNVSC